MFSPEIKIEQLNHIGKGTMVDHLGIEFTEIGQDYLKAKMPVDKRTIQPYGLLHGGASVALAETMGSVAATLVLKEGNQYAVGLDINANHVKSARSGDVTGICQPIHVGKGTHVWQIKIFNEIDELVCISRITMAILSREK